MRRANRMSDSAGRLRGDQGSASIEFLSAAVLLLIPLVYLVVAVSVVQSTALGVEGAARQAARVYVRASSEAQAQRRVEAVVGVVAADHGLDRSKLHVSVQCAPRPTNCLYPTGTVTVALRYDATLPFVPVLDSVSVATLRAEATQPVSRFGGRR